MPSPIMQTKTTPCIHDRCPNPGTAVSTNDGRGACSDHVCEAFSINAGSR